MIPPRRQTMQRCWLALACLLVLASQVAAPDSSVASPHLWPRPGKSQGVRKADQRVRTPRVVGHPHRRRGRATDARLVAILWAPRLAPGAMLGPPSDAARPPTASDRERLADSLQDEIAPPDPPSPSTGETPSIAWPLAGPINSLFGPRHGRFHAGIDIGAARDKVVQAAAAGVALYAGNSHGPMGQAVILQHEGGLQTIYAHLGRLRVREGTFVRQGDPIGTVGCTGRVTGPHLHFGVRVDGTTVNPQVYLPASLDSPDLPLPTHASAQ
jgi:murein DD-endopeptidase MepM/ murein hydrolase activator NlpD